MLRKTLLITILLCATRGWGAWTSIGTTNTANSKVSGTTVVITSGVFSSTNQILVCATAWSNTDTTDGNTTRLSISDDSGEGLTWVKLGEFTNTVGGAADDGATVAAWVSTVPKPTTTSTNITFTSDTARTSKAAGCWTFTIGSGNVISQTGSTQTLANDNADAGSQELSSLANSEHLFFRAIATESNVATIATTTASYTNGTGAATSGGGEATNMGIDYEFIISTATGSTSDPTMTDTTADRASIFFALDEAAAGGGGTTHPGWYGGGWF